MLDRHKLVAELLLKSGHAVPIDETTKKLRANLGLAEVPPTTHMFRDALAEVQEIVKKTNFDKLVGYAWK